MDATGGCVRTGRPAGACLEPLPWLLDAGSPVLDEPPQLPELRDRQRDLLPLPPRTGEGGPWITCHFGRSTRRRIGVRRHRDAWMQQGLNSLNELGGVDRQFCNSQESPSQRAAADHVQECYAAMGRPPPGMTHDGSLEGILAKATHSQKARTVQSYDKSKVNWPPVGSAPVELLPMLEETDQDCFPDWPRCPPEEAVRMRQELGLRRAYRDPALFGDGTDFLHRLRACGMARWVPAGKRRGLLGALCVSKANDLQRLIMDTRLVNAYFRTPATTDPPMAGGLSNLELPIGAELKFAAANLKDCFHA